MRVLQAIAGAEHGGAETYFVDLMKGLHEAGLEPVVNRYGDRKLRRYFRADAAIASPEVYEFLEAEGFLYAIRLPANRVLQECIAHLLTRPVGRPPNHVRRFYARLSYRANNWDKARRVVAKVEWHPGELFPRVGFIVTNLSRPAGRVVAFYNQRGTAEQNIMSTAKQKGTTVAVQKG